MIFIKDEEFIRGDCPMTKEEVRILSITKLELEEDYKVLDIGAGTGSVSIQISKICSKGSVIAIEKDPAALEVLYKNKEKFSAENLQVIEGEAIDKEPLIEEKFDAIFIGGSGKNLEDLIRKYSLKLKDNKKIVLNFITIDNLYKGMSTLKAMNYSTECIQVSISKTKGEGYMMLANNSIFILSGRKRVED